MKTLKAVYKGKREQFAGMTNSRGKQNKPNGYRNQDLAIMKYREVHIREVTVGIVIAKWISNARENTLS